MSGAEGTVPRKCLACHAELSSPIVCQGCHTLYPLPKSVDHFGLLGLKRAYDVDPREVRERFVAISRHVHPDYFSDAGEEMGQLATRLSAELNEAVKVLSDPVLRAGYLLETSGGPGAADDRTVPAAVLGEAMMLREEIEEAQQSGDSDALGRLHRTVEGRRAQLLEAIASLAGTLADAGDEQRKRLRHTINAIKYYDNMLEILWGA